MPSEAEGLCHPRRVPTVPITIPLSVLEGGEGGGSAMLWRESQGSLNSSASLDLGFLSSASTAASPWTEVSCSHAGPTASRCYQPGLIPLHPSRRAIGRAWGAVRQTCRPSP